MWIGQCALQRVIGRSKHLAKKVQPGCQDINPAGIEPGKPVFAANQMKGSTLASSSFRERQRAIIEVEGRQRPPAIWNFTLRAPTEPARDHKMYHQPDPVLQSKGDSLANATELHHFLTFRSLD